MEKAGSGMVQTRSHREKKLVDELVRSGLLRGAAICGPSGLTGRVCKMGRLCPASPRGFICVKGPPPVNAQHRAGSARAPSLEPGTGAGFAAGARRATPDPGRRSSPRRAQQPS